MNPFMAEIIGTMILVLLGNGVVAGVVLQKSKSHQGGWIVITAGWGLAVAVAVYMVGAISGAHLNPAVTIAMATISQGDFSWGQVPGYILAQIIGAVMGSVLVWMTYLPHWKETPDQDAKRATFCTAPAIRNTISNLICEIIGTFVLVLGVYAINPARDLGPRIAHAILPIPGKGDNDWSYAWIPVVGPIIGGIIGAVVYKLLWVTA
jgi:glycerol uptake facilitator protein